MLPSSITSRQLLFLEILEEGVEFSMGKFSPHKLSLCSIVLLAFEVVARLREPVKGRGKFVLTESRQSFNLFRRDVLLVLACYKYSAHFFVPLQEVGEIPVPFARCGLDVHEIALRFSLGLNVSSLVLGMILPYYRVRSGRRMYCEMLVGVSSKNTWLFKIPTLQNSTPPCRFLSPRLRVSTPKTTSELENMLEKS